MSNHREITIEDCNWGYFVECEECLTSYVFGQDGDALLDCLREDDWVADGDDEDMVIVCNVCKDLDTYK